MYIYHFPITYVSIRYVVGGKLGHYHCGKPLSYRHRSKADVRLASSNDDLVYGHCPNNKVFQRIFFYEFIDEFFDKFSNFFDEFVYELF